MPHTEALTGFADLCDYLGLAADGVVVTKTGVHLAGWEYTGYDMDALPLEESAQYAARLGRQLGLGEGWSLQADLIRGEWPEYITTPGAWRDPGPLMIEQERRSRFLMNGDDAVRDSRRYFCLSYDPAISKVRGLARLLVGIKEEDEEVEPQAAILTRFQLKVEEIEAILAQSTVSVRRLKGYLRLTPDGEIYCDEFLEYLRYCISGELFAFAAPPDGIELCSYFAEDITGGMDMQFGNPDSDVLPGYHVRVLCVDGFSCAKSFAGMLRALDGVPYNFRFCQQLQIKDEVKAAADHQINMKKWRTKGQGGVIKSKDGVKVEDLDSNALTLAGDAAQARSDVEHGKVFDGRYSGKFILMYRDRRKIADAAECIRCALRRVGIKVRVEDINGAAAWFGSFPGQQYRDQRTFTITTDNFSHFMMLSSPYRGVEENQSQFFAPGSPPLAMALTAGSAAYRFHGHVGDVGHSVVVGPTGSGKTSLIALMMASALRYADVQVYAFDRRRSLYTMTQCLGGEFVDLGPDGSVELCPLSQLENASQIQWAEQYIAFLAEMNGLTVTPAIRNDISLTVFRLSCSSSTRSLTAFHAACGDPALKSALQFYLKSLLNGNADTLHVSKFMTFEMEELCSLDPRIMNGALFYVFGRIRQRLCSEIPTFMFVDEFTAALGHPIAAEAFRKYLFEGRSLNLALWAVVQEIATTLASPLRAAILGMPKTKIFLAAPQAILSEAANYELMGCSAVDRVAIANATPKSHYYICQPDGNRLVSFEMGRGFLAFLSSGDKDRRKLNDWIRRYGRSEAVARWLEHQDLPEHAAQYRRLVEEFEELREVQFA